jgi:hypothetical protein
MTKLILGVPDTKVSALKPVSAAASEHTVGYTTGPARILVGPYWEAGGRKLPACTLAGSRVARLSRSARDGYMLTARRVLAEINGTQVLVIAGNRPMRTTRGGVTAIGGTFSPVIAAHRIMQAAHDGVTAIGGTDVAIVTIHERMPAHPVAGVTCIGGADSVIVTDFAMQPTILGAGA